jgi:hypothetical protein
MFAMVGLGPFQRLSAPASRQDGPAPKEAADEDDGADRSAADLRLGSRPARRNFVRAPAVDPERRS